MNTEVDRLEAEARRLERRAANRRRWLSEALAVGATLPDSEWIACNDSQLEAEDARQKYHAALDASEN